LILETEAGPGQPTPSSQEQSQTHD
jgi:hypothetical protein